MKLHNAQKQIAKDTHRFRVLCCGRRFGKTILAIEEMVGVAISKKNMRVAYYAPTRDDAKEITWNLLIKKCENIITYKNESLLQLKIMSCDGGESMIALYGWESVQSRGKGRGLANDMIVCDEVAFYRNFWAGWNEVLSPTLIDRKGLALFISTPKGFNHFYDLYNLQEKDPDYVSFHFTTYDNPNIPIEEIEREKLSKPEDAFAQEYLADFRKQEGLVYKEFNRKEHIFDDFTPRRQVIAKIGAVDFGYTNPAVVLEIEKDADNHYWVKKEFYKRGQTDSNVADYVKAQGFNYVFPDPENPAGIRELTDRGVNIREVVKNRDSVRNGISKVRELFKQGRLHIHKDCANLINELETYHYDVDSDDENPVKEDDHAVDAMRYCIMTDEPYIEDSNEEFSMYASSFR